MGIQTSYLVFVALFNMGMAITFVPYAPYLLSLGLTMGEVSLVNAWFLGACLLAEIPTGLFADRVSRAHSVRLGVAWVGCASLLYSTADGFMTALIYEIMIGIGLAFMNGALAAWVRDAMVPPQEEVSSDARMAKEVAYKHLTFLATIVQAVAFIVGGYLGWEVALWEGYRLGWVMTASCMALALVWSLYAMRTDRMQSHPDRNFALVASLRALRGRSGLWWAIGAALSFNLVAPFNHFWSPFLIGRLGEGTLGWAWVLLCLPMILMGQVLRRSRRDKVHPGMLIGSLLLAGGTLAVVVAAPGAWSLVIIVLHEGARGCYLPLLEIFTQQRIESEYRATYMSLQSFLAKCGGVVVLSAVWIGTRDLPANEATISLIWSTSGFCLVVCALALWFFRPRT